MFPFWVKYLNFFKAINENKRATRNYKRKVNITNSTKHQPQKLKMPTFSLSEYLTKFQTSNKASFPEVDDPSRQLNYVIDSLAISSEQINDDDTFDALLDLCQGFQHLPQKFQTQLTYLVASSLSSCSSDIKANIESNTDYNDLIDLIPRWKMNLEAYSYLVHVLLFFQQESIHTIMSHSTVNRKSKGDTGTPSNVELFRKVINQIESLCESIITVLNLDLKIILQTTPEKDLFVALFTRPLHSLMDVEATVKIGSLKMLVQRIFCLSVKNHGQSMNIQTSIMSDLTYFLHLSNFNAELLSLLNSDFQFTQLTEDVLKEISNRVFSSKDTTGPKAISAFLVKLSELSPLVMLRQLSQLITLLNSSIITLRSALVESCGNIVAKLISHASDNLSQRQDLTQQQIDTLIELLEERFCDSNPFVRTKAVQGCLKLINLNVTLNSKYKIEFTKLAVRSLSDKSSLVRRNTIKLLSQLLLKHPFAGIHGDQLKLADWLSYASSVKRKLGDNISNNSIAEEETTREHMEDIHKSAMEIMNNSQSELNSPTNLIKLKLMEKYYTDAVNFIKDMHKSIYLVSILLFSKNRNEVLEAMDFVILTDAFNLDPSEKAIKKMLHLVWMKGTNDEGTSIASHLISCYKQLFFSVPDNISTAGASKYIADNLIGITMDSSVSDLTSLEKLLCAMYKQDMITNQIINVLWEIYSYPISRPNYSTTPQLKKQVHGSIIILGMLALEDGDIITKGLQYLLKVGLDRSGDADLTLCKYSCVALERIVRKGENLAIDEKQEEVTVKKIYSKIIRYTTDTEFYPMCEQALNALFVVSSRPDLITANLIKEKTMMTFGNSEEPNESTIERDTSRITSLSQLLFIVGQVAIRSLLYLEKCEAEFKRKKLVAESLKVKDPKYVNTHGGEQNDEDEEKDAELAMIGGTNEDDFSDAIQFVKEEELLFSKNSILGKFCPLVEAIVSNSSRFSDPLLQRSACLCLEKLMCVSSKYCEKSLPLLITVMEKSPDPIVRSNAVLGLGDMAVCFNNLVDENTDYLYRRLHDDDIMVQRTCLMTVTFLILAGQVKVKGQLGEMAKCLENPDQSISNMCRLFFTELATKDNAIYNGFIDIFSNLASDKVLKKESFKKIMKFLISFVDKDRHQRQLSEKLYGRLITCSNQKQWDDIAYVLNCIPYSNETISTRLKEGYKLVETDHDQLNKTVSA